MAKQCSIHSKKICHRDLKPENILVSLDDKNPVIKITDIGFSKLVDPRHCPQDILRDSNTSLLRSSRV